MRTRRFHLLAWLGAIGWLCASLTGALANTNLPVWPVVGSFVAPPPLEQPLQQPETPSTPLNIILVIGDGMGQGAYDVTSLHLHGVTRKLVMQHLPIAGLCETYSANSSVTDSAAGGTALACGEKTNNQRIGMTADKKKLKSIARFAREMGKSVAIITDDALYGATPAVFFANQDSRSKTHEIIADAAECGFDILIGNHLSTNLFVANGVAPNQRNLQAEMEADGYTFVTTLEAFAAVPENRKVVGHFASGILNAHDSKVATLINTALERLSKNPNGFFMMVESTYPDSGGHGNNTKHTLRGTVRADWIVRTLIDFAADRNDTLIVVTADHETGGLYTVQSAASNSTQSIVYTSTGHTGAPVPVYAYGPFAEQFGGHINNVHIPRRMAALWGITLPAELTEGVQMKQVVFGK